MNVIHYMHDKYAYERDRDGAARLRAAAHDGVRHRRPVGRGRQPVGDQVREGEGRSATRPASSPTTRPRASFPCFGNNDNRVDQIASCWCQHVHEQAAEVSDLPQRAAHAVGADHHVERRLRQGDRQHAGRPPQGRAVRAGRQPDARPRHHGIHASALLSVAKIPYRDAAGRHLADDDAGADGLGRDAEDRITQPHRACSTRSSARPAST